VASAPRLLHNTRKNQVVLLQLSFLSRIAALRQQDCPEASAIGTNDWSSAAYADCAMACSAVRGLTKPI
ncbi:MAG TPA: hypothetical protein VMT89_19005, partial [Candidatus Acidoferrales bacterium]|nr:hypothetical protein [Candidatus Acidoferrales bacterium]